MWRKKLKHRKHQFLLIGLVIAFATAIFAGCISFTLETNVYAKQFFNNDDQCPNIISLTKGSNMQDYFLKNDEVMTNIKEISYQSAKYIEATMNFSKKTIPNSYTAVIAVENYHKLPYFMKLTDGDIKVNAPGNDEIWISNALADEYGISVGDKISFNGTYQKELTVSALYNSAVIPSGMMGIFPFYTNEATLQQFDESDATYITVLFKDGVDADTALSSLSSDYSSNVYYSFDRQALNLTYSTTSTLFGSIGTLAALIIFIVTVILIRFLLRTTLIKEYRSIGIYKSLGYTSKQIIGFYRNCYLFVGAIAIPIGILLGTGIAYILGGITNQYLDGYHTTVITLYTGFFSFFLLMLILIGNVILTLRSIPKITPVKALTIGLTSSKVKMKRSLIRNAHSSLSMAINQIFKRKAMSIMVLFILTVSFYLSLFFSSINYTCSNIENHTDIWFGLPKYDCMASAPVTQELKDTLDNSNLVKKVTYCDWSIDEPDYRCNTTGKDLSGTSIISYSSFDSSDADFTYAEGRPPRNSKEIAITSKQIDNFGGSTGDYVNLTLNGHTDDYLITGVFTSMMQGGQNIHILNSELDACGVQYADDEIIVQLKDGVTIEQLQNEVSNQFPNVKFEENIQSLKSAVISIDNLSSPITTLLVIVFILFSILNITNLLMMNNLENRKQYGILKALGFTNQYICMQNLLRILILSGFAAILSLVIHTTLSSDLFYCIIKVKALSSPLTLSIGMVAVIMAIIIAITLLFTIPLRKVVPTDLMEE